MKIYNIFIRYILFLMATIISIPLLAQSRHVDPLDSVEVQLFNEVRLMPWKASLTNQEIEKVNAAFNSSKDILAVEASKVIAIHKLQNKISKNFINDVVPKQGYIPFIKRVILKAGKNNITVENEILQSLDSIAASKGEKNKQLKEQLISIIIYQSAKKIRNGENISISIPEAELTEFQKLLLLYSSKPTKKSVQEIIAILAKANIAGTTEYNLVEVLNTYGKTAVDSLVEFITETKTLENSTNYGRLLIVRSIIDNSYLTSPDNKRKLTSLLSQDSIINNYFSSPASLKFEALLLKGKVK